MGMARDVEEVGMGSAEGGGEGKGHSKRGGEGKGTRVGHYDEVGETVSSVGKGGGMGGALEAVGRRAAVAKENVWREGKLR